MTKIKKEIKRIIKGQIIILMVLAAITVLILLITPAHAQTITMANPNTLTERDIAVYFPNGTMQGLYNTSSTITIDGNSDYIFSIVPRYETPLDDPKGWFTSLIAYANDNAVVLFFIAVIVGIALVRARRG